ncbi:MULTISPECIES: TylF/MycF/NovP-related O-methyltransferase [Roseivirga]|uniref:Macrocin O-methyltransferase n=1 Tax=Roseivirga spongicola TaxID=333140 RepID=A0A150X424_9BACT|nr:MULTISPECIES: TylF/MycF/NovP-related O-methyltransferase [Roseivirga]KYG73476.1 hypothetical protein AWW68_12340 [Roseivirga spongicola]MBO6659739.1 class I SAM-dependent methyltransferase [Roseivirga sp.]MBO6760289.1 class I SAM-dependent methyltransferase [Roseivirga sp.]MBO6907524.1 class I SAM-dependent methyltransferase [Roseivirga sp.]WPZ09898.1 TylF/MycF/NovP-related O-methyltransferase [Roseivirga spongicola]
MEIRKRYIDLLKMALLNEHYLENELRIQALAEGWVQGKSLLNRRIAYEKLHNIKKYYASEFELMKERRNEGRHLAEGSQHLVYAHTMIGRKRMDNIQRCFEQLISENIQGDLIECGVWNGGATIFMAGLLQAYQEHDRKVWVADSFDGVPVPELEEDKEFDISKKVFPGLAVGLEEVKNNFDKYDLLKENVEFLPGLFSSTLPNAPINEIAVLRLDGDLYESTMDSLNALYDRVVSGGFVIVDDYGVLPPCKKAVDEFREKRNISNSYQWIDWSGIYWRK